MKLFLAKLKSIFSDSPVEIEQPFSFAAGKMLRPPRSTCIFLDFDGVLHRGENETFEFLPNFVTVLKSNPHIDVIISSSWKDSCSMEMILDIFPSHIHHRIAGATQTIPSTQYTRHHEIQSTVSRYKILRYIAVDDSDQLFPPDCTYLFKTSRTTGLSHIVIPSFQTFIDSKLAKS